MSDGPSNEEVTGDESEVAVDQGGDEAIEEGGDAACWAHLVCPECGRVTEPGVVHRCGEDDDAQPAATTT